MILLILFMADKITHRSVPYLDCAACCCFLRIHLLGFGGGEAEQEDATFKANKHVIAGECVREEEDVIHPRRIWRFTHRAEGRETNVFQWQWRVFWFWGIDHEIGLAGLQTCCKVCYNGETINTLSLWPAAAARTLLHHVHLEIFIYFILFFVTFI